MAAPIGNLGSAWPLYLIDINGNPEQIGRLHALAGKAWFLERTSETGWQTLVGEQFPDGIFPDLPWFLDDARPQGFLGRAFARKHGSQLGEGRDPTRWSPVAVTESLLRFGGDLPGAFVLGGEALRAAVAGAEYPGIAPEERAHEYPRLAAAALEGDITGSSAGGEQPKFPALVVHDGEIRNVLVKFSGERNAPEHQRWADLLVAEHVAARVLRDNGFAAAHSEIIDSEGRRFLEIGRFDRLPSGGRLPVVSLRALDAAFYRDLNTPWSDAADRLEEDGWLTLEDAETLRALWAFGELIGNNDMHYGNVSLVLNQKRPVSLTPVYDMLPMGYRPGLEGRLPERISIPSNQAALENERARIMAAGFWARLSKSPLISDEFRHIAMTHRSESSVD